MSYTNRQLAAYPSVSLHDCLADRLEVFGDRLEFVFENGFTLTPRTALNPEDACADTGRAALVFTGAEAEFYLYREHRLFGIRLCTTVKQLSMEQLAQKLGSGRWKLEFIGEHYGYRSAVYTCWIHRRRRPWFMDCRLDVCYEQAEYFWNDAR